MTMVYSRRGFTLIELMVGLTISAGLLMSGRLMLEQLGSAAHTIVVESAINDTTIAHERLLHSLVRNLEVGTDSTTTFEGEERTMRFTSWCFNVALQRLRCTVQFSIDTALTVSTSVAPPTVLMRTANIGRFRYLADARDGGRWYRNWGPGITVPLAIGIIAGDDTTVLRIGDRQ